MGAPERKKGKVFPGPGALQFVPTSFSLSLLRADRVLETWKD